MTGKYAGIYNSIRNYFESQNDDFELNSQNKALIDYYSKIFEYDNDNDTKYLFDILLNKGMVSDLSIITKGIVSNIPIYTNLLINTFIFMIVKSKFNTKHATSVFLIYDMDFIVLFQLIIRCGIYYNTTNIDLRFTRSIFIELINDIQKILKENKSSLIQTGYPANNPTIMNDQFFTYGVTLYPVKICDSLQNFSFKPNDLPNNNSTIHTFIADKKEFYKPYSERNHTTYENAATFDFLSKEDIALIESNRHSLFNIKMQLLENFKDYASGSLSYVNLFSSCFDSISILSDNEFEYFCNGYLNSIDSFFKNIRHTSDIDNSLLVNDETKRSKREYWLYDKFLLCSGCINILYILVPAIPLFQESSTLRFLVDDIFPLISTEHEDFEYLSPDLIDKYDTLWIKFKILLINDIVKCNSAIKSFNYEIKRRFKTSINNTNDINQLIHQIIDLTSEFKVNSKTLSNIYPDIIQIKKILFDTINNAKSSFVDSEIKEDMYVFRKVIDNQSKKPRILREIIYKQSSIRINNLIGFNYIEALLNNPEIHFKATDFLINDTEISLLMASKIKTSSHNSEKTDIIHEQTQNMFNSFSKANDYYSRVIEVDKTTKAVKVIKKRLNMSIEDAYLYEELLRRQNELKEEIKAIKSSEDTSTITELINKKKKIGKEIRTLLYPSDKEYVAKKSIIVGNISYALEYLRSEIIKISNQSDREIMLNFYTDFSSDIMHKKRFGYLHQKTRNCHWITKPILI